MKSPPSARFVNGKGPAKCDIAFVGEQPGKTEVVRGEPFVGPAGRELDQCLANAMIPRSSCYVTNVIKDLNKPLKFYIDLPPSTSGNAKVSEEGRQYIEYLKEELEYVRPNIVVGLGNIALFALADRWGITKWRGSIIESTLLSGQKLISTFHPSTILPKYSGQKKDELKKHQITFDLRRAKKHSSTPTLHMKQYNISLEPNYIEALTFLDECSRQPVIDFDVEVVNEQLFCIAFAFMEDGIPQAMTIPFVKGHDYWHIDQEMRIIREIAKLLENPYLIKRGQNLAFDVCFMLNRYGIKTRGKLHDTMIAQKISLPDFPAGLDYIVSVHTEMPYYKAEGKKYMKVGGDWAQFQLYNSRDALATLESHPNQMKDIHLQDNNETYERHCKLIYPLTYMQQRGIKVDVEGMLKARKETQAKVSNLETELWSIAGYQVNYNSPKQMKEYFYEKKGIQPYIKRGAKGPVATVDVNALKRLARGTAVRAPMREAKIVMELRSLTAKTLGTYLSLDKIDPDGRYRSQYNPVGAKTGRLSSSENIFGTGGNQQNWPHILLKYLLADDGYMAYSYDLSQIENRIVAYVGMVVEMMEAFENGDDVHSLTAGMLLDKLPEEISDEDGSCSMGDGSHSERFWGKKANHSLNYDIGIKQFALINEITEGDAKKIITMYHKGYPGVRQNFHKLVQNELRKNRTLTNLFGRKRLFLGTWNNDLFKEAYAHIPQSTTADKINEQGLNFVYYNQSRFGEVELLRQVHDDIGFQIPLSLPWDVHARILWEIKASLETPLVWHDREFVVPADLTMGFNFGKKDSKEIKSKSFPASVDKLALKLKEVHDELKQQSLA